MSLQRGTDAHRRPKILPNTDGLKDPEVKGPGFFQGSNLPSMRAPVGGSPLSVLDDAGFEIPPWKMQAVYRGQNKKHRQLLHKEETAQGLMILEGHNMRPNYAVKSAGIAT